MFGDSYGRQIHQRRFGSSQKRLRKVIDPTDSTANSSVKRVVKNVSIKCWRLSAESSHRFKDFLSIVFSVFVALPFKGLERLNQMNCDNNHDASRRNNLANVSHFSSHGIGEWSGSTSIQVKRHAVTQINGTGILWLEMRGVTWMPCSCSKPCHRRHVPPDRCHVRLQRPMLLNRFEADGGGLVVNH